MFAFHDIVSSENAIFSDQQQLFIEGAVVGTPN